MGDRQEGASALTTMIIDGKPATAASGATTAIINPVDGSELCQVPDGDGRDVDRAVEAAAAAFPEWSRTSPAETDDAGKPIRLSTEFDIPGTIDNIAFFAGAARHLEGKAAAEYSPGKDQSMYSFEEYTQIKHVMIERRGDMEKEWHRTMWRRQKED